MIQRRLAASAESLSCPPPLSHQLPLWVFLAFSLFFTFTSERQASAWGLQKELGPTWKDSYLISKVFEKHSIDFCLDIADPQQFSPQNLEIEVKAALKVWLAALQPVDGSPVSLSLVDCSDANYDLKVEVGPELAYPKLGGYFLQRKDHNPEHSYSLIKIPTTYFYVSSTGTRYATVDFAMWYPQSSSHSSQPGAPFETFLEELSLKEKLTVWDFAETNHLDYISVFRSTYRLLIHELGHAFGLCDTYESQFEIECDHQHRSTQTSSEQPDSVMKSSNYFYLTADDIQGASEAYRRASELAGH